MIRELTSILLLSSATIKGCNSRQLSVSAPAAKTCRDMKVLPGVRQQQ